MKFNNEAWDKIESLTVAKIELFMDFTTAMSAISWHDDEFLLSGKPLLMTEYPNTWISINFVQALNDAQLESLKEGASDLNDVIQNGLWLDFNHWMIEHDDIQAGNGRVWGKPSSMTGKTADVYNRESQPSRDISKWVSF